MESAFEVIAEPNRRAILGLLSISQQTVGEIEQQLGMPQPTVSKHLRVLRDLGFVESTVDAQRRLYRLNPAPLREVDAWLDQFRRFWMTHVDALERHLDRMDPAPMTKKTTARKAPPAARKAARKTAKPILLSGDNPQIPKGEGEAPVRAYITAIPGWKRKLARDLDAIIVRTVPGVHKAVKWNSPFYGMRGHGWFVSFHCFTNYIKVTFFNGASLRPVPPGASKHPKVRYYDIRDGELDEAQFAAWVKQASVLPGEKL
ncbi:MAG TPA: metalloregulator ArsR/SmtB family transcription factor [Vicinamibacterales bacterium]|nr:metalloregulator ArsR/SmtB family transcription factor [Vicinamibacterales bacterium]